MQNILRLFYFLVASDGHLGYYFHQNNGIIGFLIPQHIQTEPEFMLIVY